MHAPVFLYREKGRVSTGNLRKFGFPGGAVRRDMRGTEGQWDAGLAAGAAGVVDFRREVMLAMKLALLRIHGNTLPNRGVQGRLATSSCRAATVRAALHAVAGGGLLGDAAGDRAGQYGARAAAGNHALHYGKRGKAGACGDQRT